MPSRSTAKPPATRTRVNEKLGTWSERFPVLSEAEGRLQKAAKILAVLRNFGDIDPASSILLEVGSSTGIMAGRFAQEFGRVIAFDPDHSASSAGAARARTDHELGGKMKFLLGDGCRMPIAAATVDVVVCNQIYEHVDDQPALLAEIYRVLRPGGVCYFGLGTRHVIIEGHYQLPFLSWLPPRWADWYIKLRGRELKYDVKLLSYRRLKKLVRRFSIYDYTVAVIKNPAKYAAGDVLGGWSWCSSIPCWFWQVVRPLLPAHIWLLRKPDLDESPREVVVQS